MTIAYPVPSTYEFAIGYAAVDSIQVAPSIVNLTPSNINPEELLSFTRKHGEATIPEGDGARLLSDGKLGPETITFFGAMAGDDPEDTFSTMAARLSSIAQSTQQSYVKAGLFDGSAKVFFRRYGMILSAHAAYARRTQYHAITGFEMDYRVLDPWWYWDSQRSATVAVSGGAGSQATSDTGISRSKRATIIILRTGSGVPTNVTVSNNAGQSFTMTGSLATAGDYWKIDMFTGVVQKSVSTVVSDDIANFSGQFWGIKFGSDTITVSSTGGGTWSVLVAWLERRM